MCRNFLFCFFLFFLGGKKLEKEAFVFEDVAGIFLRRQKKQKRREMRNGTLLS